MALNRTAGDPMREVDRLFRRAKEFRQQGRYQEAIVPMTQARDLTCQHLGQHHPAYATSLDNLAFLCAETGDYAAAEPLFQAFHEALGIYRATLGEHHPAYATSLSHLRFCTKRQGTTRRLGPLPRGPRDLPRDAGREPPRLYRQPGQPGAAVLRDRGLRSGRALIRLGLEIVRATRGDDHPDYARSLDRLAGLYCVIGYHATAAPLLHEALGIYRATLGECHPAYATSLSHLAVLYQAMGDYTAAEALYYQALGIYRATLGESHPDYTGSLDNLARLYARSGTTQRPRPSSGWRSKSSRGAR